MLPLSKIYLRARSYSKYECQIRLHINVNSKLASVIVKIIIIWWPIYIRQGFLVMHDSKIGDIRRNDVHE